MLWQDISFTIEHDLVCSHFADIDSILSDGAVAELTVVIRLFDPRCI